MIKPDTSVSAPAFQCAFYMADGARVALQGCGVHIFDVEVLAS